MDEVLYTNIFFLITGIATIIISTFLVVVLYRIIRILRVVERIADQIHDGTELIAEDIQQFRRYISEGSIFSFILAPFLTALRPKKERDTARKPRKDDTRKSELVINGEK